MNPFEILLKKLHIQPFATETALDEMSMVITTEDARIIMKEYAELYAEKCIAQLSLSLNVEIEIVNFKPISHYQIELPEHE
jgi:hypothetical protein